MSQLSYIDLVSLLFFIVLIAQGFKLEAKILFSSRMSDRDRNNRRNISCIACLEIESISMIFGK